MSFINCVVFGHQGVCYQSIFYLTSPLDLWVLCRIIRQQASAWYFPERCWITLCLLDIIFVLYYSSTQISSAPSLFIYNKFKVRLNLIITIQWLDDFSEPSVDVIFFHNTLKVFPVLQIWFYHWPNVDNLGVFSVTLLWCSEASAKFCSIWLICPQFLHYGVSQYDSFIRVSSFLEEEE